MNTLVSHSKQPESAVLIRLEQARASCLDLAEALRYDHDHAWCLHLLSLYGSVLEYAHAIAVAVKGDAGIAVSVLLRSMLEAAIDLRNLASDQAYGYCLEANAIDGKLKFLQSMRDDDSSAAVAVRAQPDFLTRLTELEARRSQIVDRAGNRNDRNIKARFLRAGEARAYNTLYAALCSAGHNDIAALAERHVVAVGGINQVHFHREVSIHNLDDRLVHTLCLISSATVDVHKALESEARDRATALKAEIDQFIADIAQQ